MAWGEPRATMDVDALVKLEREAVSRFVAALATEKLKTSPEDLMAAVGGEGHASIFDEDSTYHVDLKVAKTESEREEIAAAVDVVFAPGRLRVASAEDTIAYKLLFGSEQDHKDARSILVRNPGRLDRQRLERLVRGLGVEKQLRELENAIGSPLKDSPKDP